MDETVEKARILHAEAQALEERLQFIEQQILELWDFEEGLRKLEVSKQHELLAGIGKGVFLKSSSERKELFVDVGSGVIVKKDIHEIIAVIGEQIEKLESLREDARERL